MIVLHYVAQILRQVVPLMDHPSERFLASLEEDLVKLVMKHGQMVSQHGVVGGVADCDGHKMCCSDCAELHPLPGSSGE